MDGLALIAASQAASAAPRDKAHVLDGASVDAVVATVALFLALGGGGFAVASHLTVRASG